MSAKIMYTYSLNCCKHFVFFVLKVFMASNDFLFCDKLVLYTRVTSCEIMPKPINNKNVLTAIAPPLFM